MLSRRGWSRGTPNQLPRNVHIAALALLMIGLTMPPPVPGDYIYGAKCQLAPNPCTLPVPATEPCNACAYGVECGKPVNPPASNPCTTSYQWVLNASYGICVECDNSQCYQFRVGCILEQTCVPWPLPDNTTDCRFMGSIAFDTATGCLFQPPPAAPQCGPSEPGGGDP